MSKEMEIRSDNLYETVSYCGGGGGGGNASTTASTSSNGSSYAGNTQVAGALDAAV